MSAAVRAFTDGACRGNPGPGGWGVLLQAAELEKELCGGMLVTTNNRMELTAVIRALEALKRPVPVEIVTDSQYVMLGTTRWMADWKRRGWRTAARQPVKNEDLWRELDALVTRHAVSWRWVRGHAGDVGNERADALANRGLEDVLRAGPGAVAGML